MSHDQKSSKQASKPNKYIVFVTFICIILMLVTAITMKSNVSQTSNTNPFMNNNYYLSTNGRKLLQSTNGHIPEIANALRLRLIPSNDIRTWYHYDPDFKTMIDCKSHTNYPRSFKVIPIHNKPLYHPSWNRYVVYTLDTDDLREINERRKDDGLEGVIRIAEINGDYVLILWDQISETLFDKEFGIHNSFLNYHNHLTAV